MQAIFFAAAAAGLAQLSLSNEQPLAHTSRRLFSVTIDTCALKQALDFGDPLLIALSAHLGPAILRIGGSDQNHFAYDMESNLPMKPCACGHTKYTCTMTAPYYQSINAFANRTNLSILFGLSPASVSNASALIRHTARNNLSCFAYSWGNEQTGDDHLARVRHPAAAAVLHHAHDAAVLEDVRARDPCGRCRHGTDASQVQQQLLMLGNEAAVRD